MKKNNNFLNSRYGIKLLLVCVLSSFVFGSNSFERTQTQDVVNLHYVFDDYKHQSHEVNLQINKQDLNNSYNKIPTLAVLNEMFNKQIPTYANSMMQPYINRATKEFEMFHSSTANYIDNELGELSDDFDINVTCPTKPFIYKTLIKNKQITHKLIIKGCSTKPYIKKAYTRLIKDLQDIANETNDKMDDGSYIAILQNKQGYKIEIMASSKYSSLIKNAKNLMVGYQEDYDNDVDFVSGVSKEVFNNYKNVISDISAELNEDLSSLSDMLQVEQEALFDSHYLKLVRQNNDRYNVFIHYKKLIDEFSYELLKPDVATTDLRERLNFYLNFLQSINYNTLRGRSIKGYAGFLAPLALLDSNKGDCDTKSTAFLSLAKADLKNTRSALFLTSNHAFIGVAIKPKDGDATFTYDGVTYVLAESAGPAVAPLGVISQDTQYAIDSGAIEYVLKF